MENENKTNEEIKGNEHYKETIVSEDPRKSTVSFDFKEITLDHKLSSMVRINKANEVFDALLKASALIDYKDPLSAPIDETLAAKTGVLQISDIYYLFSGKFTVSANKALSKRVYDLCPTRIIEKDGESYRVCDRVEYFGSMAIGEDNIHMAVDGIINIVNELSLLDYIEGTLMPLSIIELSSNTSKKNFAILSYLALNEEGLKYLKLKKMKENIQEEGQFASVYS